MASWRALGLGQVERIACTLSGPKGRGWKGIARPGNSSSKGTGTGDVWLCVGEGKAIPGKWNEYSSGVATG